MRVSDKMGLDQVNRNIQKNRSEMSDLQTQAATQKRINKPSDDPVAAARLLGTRSEDRGNAQYLKNIAAARSFLEYTDLSIGEMSEMLLRMKELAIQQANDAGASAETRNVVAEEVAQSFSQAVQIGNRKLGERFVFGGYQTTKSPFNTAGDYQGDDGDINVLINKDASIAMNVPGNRVFMGQGISEDGLIRPRTEPPGTKEQLRDFQQDEIRREESIKDSEQEPLRLRAPASEYSGRVKTQTETRAQPNQQGINVLGAIKQFEISLRTNDKAGIQDSIDQIDKAIAQVIHGRAQVGSRIQVLNQGQEALQKAVVDNKAVGSTLEDADVFQVMSDIARTDSTLKASLETSSKVIQPSLLDFLR